MDEIPSELFFKIVSYLSLEDKTRCKRVSKRWKLKIDNLIIKCLIATNAYTPCFNSIKWFDNDQFIDNQNYVLESKFESSFFRSTSQMLSRLSELILCNLKLTSITRALYVFNDQIEKLKIDGISDEDVVDKLYISSSKIRVLSLTNICIERIIFILPQLKMIEINNLNGTKFDFHHPTSTEHVEFECFDLCLSEFTELRILKFATFVQKEDLKENFLQNKTSLEEIHFDCDLFDELQRQRKEYKLNNLKLFYLGLNVTSLPNLQQFEDCRDDLNEARLKLYIENYSKMADRLPFESEIDWCEVEPVYSRLPVGFWKKLIYLDSIRVSKRLQDESKFFEFLGQANVFSLLEVELNCISKDQLKRISVVNPLLLHLVLVSETSVNYSEDDLKTIIAYFAFLTDLEFEFAISLDFVHFAFTSHQDLSYFAFHHKKSKFLIEESSPHLRSVEQRRYRLSKENNMLTSGSLSELLDKIRKNQNSFFQNAIIID